MKINIRNLIFVEISLDQDTILRYGSRNKEVGKIAGTCVRNTNKNWSALEWFLLRGKDSVKGILEFVLKAYRVVRRETGSCCLIVWLLTQNDENRNSQPEHETRRDISRCIKRLSGKAPLSLRLLKFHVDCSFEKMVEGSSNIERIHRVFRTQLIDNETVYFSIVSLILNVNLTSRVTIFLPFRFNLFQTQLTLYAITTRYNQFRAPLRLENWTRINAVSTRFN